MRTRNLATLMILTVLLGMLFSPAHGARKTQSFDGYVRGLDFSKAVPGNLNYQGYLVDATDSSAVTATLEMTFRLYDSETKGDELWSETHPAVQVSNGLFHVLLGSVTPFPGGLFDGSTLWLQMEVGTEEFSPRRPLVSVAYSYRANSAEMLLDNTLADLDDRWVNEGDLDHLVAADGDPDTALYVDDVGKVGIGTISPSRALHVNGDVDANAYYGDGSNLTGIAGAPDADWTISNSDMYSGVSGYVGIGTTSPTKKLHVAGNAKVDSTLFASNVSSSSPLQLQTAGTTRMYIDDTSGNVGIGTMSPEARLHVHNDEGDASIKIKGVGGINGWELKDAVLDGGKFKIIDSNDSTRLAIDPNGSVAIGGWNYAEAGLVVRKDLDDVELFIEEDGPDFLDHAKIVFSTYAGDWSVAVNAATGGLHIKEETSSQHAMDFEYSGRADIYELELRHNLNVSDSVHSGGNITAEGNVHAGGNITADGTKGFVQEDPTDPSRVIVYVCLEGPEAGTYQRGTANLVAGRAIIDLPDHFAKVTADQDLTIQLTPVGEWLQLYVVEKSPSRIVVAEAANRDGTFDYLVQGIRKGYEDYRVVRDRSELPALDR